MIRQAIAAAAALVVAGIVSFINAQPAPQVTPVEVPAVVVSVTSAPALAGDELAEGDEGWDCHAVTAHSNGVCASDLPEGFTVQGITECVTPSLYAQCPAAVRAALGR